ncbi:MAG TPA: SigE family RNA polymerase sigma factor [Actinomycetes bacterium]|nr:SigE family RNA polymerase sigma factor [Actinomycetes bacterium]
MRETGDFDAFYTHTARRMVGYVYTLIGDLAEAEDTVQEAYARAWQHWPKVSRYENPEAWVRTVSYRIAVSSWRRTMSRQRAYRRHGPPPDVPGLDTDHVALVAALRQTNPDQRRVVVLHHLVGLTVEEISHETGVPTGTIKARLARGRAAMAKHLNEDDGEFGPHAEEVTDHA